METKHTPGPWDVEVIEDILTNSPEWVDASDERIAADARLIAAAPDMYAALCAIQDGWEKNLTEAMRLVNEAIAKAEGAE